MPLLLNPRCLTPGRSLLLVLLGAGCVHGPSPEPAQNTRSVCPPPMAWTEGRERPRRIRMTNSTDVRVAVWLDNCTGHTRLGDVPPGRTFLLPLPDRLIPYAEHLRLHVYDQGAMTRFGSYAVEIEPRWTLPLELEAETPRVEVDYEDELGRPAAWPRTNGFVTSNGRGFAFLARWAENSPAVLTWQCTGNEAKLTLNHHGAAGNRIPVEVRYMGIGGTTHAEWTVSRGSAVMLRAPDRAMVEITEKAREAASLRVVVGDPAGGVVYTFDMSGFSGASKVLECFGFHGS